MSSAAERLAGLLDYLVELEQLKQSPSLSVPAEPFRAFQAEIGALPGLTFGQLHDGDDVWLSLPRLGAIPPPEPSASLEPWLELSPSADAAPALRSEVVRPAKTGEARLTLASFPGVSKVFDTYLTQEWQPWAQTERPRRDAIALYNRLFALRQSLLTGASDAPLELVWGMGVAVWKPPGARHALRYPLLTQSCEIALNAHTFELEIRPREAEASLELDGVTSLQPHARALLAPRWEEHLASLVNRPSPFDAATTAPFLKSAVELVDPAGRFCGAEAGARLGDPDPQLLLTDTWVIFARPRSVRGLLLDATAFKARLAAAPMPGAPIAPLVSARAETAPVATAGGASVYFPLPYTDAQALVVSRLARAAAVIVDGPPGTGKTHTIANVICHHLALGQRVLVTASDESALAGLRDLLPEAVRPLAVALVSSDRSAAKQFLQAAQAFATRVGSANAAEREVAAARLDARAADLQASIAAVDARIADLARNQLSPLTIGERAVAPGELARRVVEAASRHGWLTDALDPVSQATPAFSVADIAALRDARLALGTDLAYLGVALPDAAELPDEAALLALHHELVRAHRRQALNASGERLPLVDQSPQTLERALKLRDLIAKSDALHAAVDPDPFGWADRLRVRFQAREDPLARGLVTVARSVAVEDLAQRVRKTRAVELPVGVERSTEALEAIERLAAGKFGFRMPLGNKAARASLDAITVAGVRPVSAADWRRVADELEHRAKARKLLAAWNAVVSDCNLEPLSESGAGAFPSLAARADHVLKMHELVTRVEAPIRTEIPAVFASSGLADLSEHDGSLQRAAAESLAGHLDGGQLAGASSRAREVLIKLEGASGAIVDRLWTFLTTTVGRGAADSALAAEWRGLLLELRRLATLAPLLATVERVAARVAAAGALRWAASLRRIPATDGDDPWTPADWPEAWLWRIAAMQLGSLEGHDTLKQLVQRRAAAAADLDRTAQALATERAWLAVLGSPSTELRRALDDYALATRALQAPAGTRARQPRAAARAAVVRAAGVLPCVIVPQWRIAEILPAELEAFDLVVVDEASRSDTAALPALLRGKQLLILGDPMLSPPAIPTVARARRQELARRLLGEQPHGAEMAAGRSLYDLACVAYAGEPVVLREQFSSDPAIAEFSSREFYGGAIASPRGSCRQNRLDPPLLDVHVRGAARSGDVNDAEALAIARFIEAMLADEALAGRSIGVVSLLGPEQAKRIDELLRARIPPRELIARRIVVGMPVRFQGRGRSVMLLSMVLTPESPAVGDAHSVAQRFNVAVTSARDRLVLFRSVTDRDLPAESCHARLIRHFRHPFGETATPPTTPRELCRTELERAIFDALVARDFRVRPQFEVGAARIDLVVEGAGDRRLAVQCDGDAGRAPEQWSDAVALERRLERLGWSVWRCFAASFILRREHVLEDLFGTLEQLGIEPLGAAPPAPARFSAHSVVGTPRAPASREPRADGAAPAAVGPAPARAPRRSRPQR